MSRSVETLLCYLLWLARQCSTYTPFSANVESKWRIDMCLETFGCVIEARVVRYRAVRETTW
jgi:hypothetical protein